MRIFALCSFLCFSVCFTGVFNRILQREKRDYALSYHNAIKLFVRPRFYQIYFANGITSLIYNFISLTEFPWNSLVNFPLNFHFYDKHIPFELSVLPQVLKFRSCSLHIMSRGDYPEDS